MKKKLQTVNHHLYTQQLQLPPNNQPINRKGYQKAIMTRAFYKSFIKANNSLDAVEKAIKEGNTTKEIENSGW